jgi:hypothetical protein
MQREAALTLRHQAELAEVAASASRAAEEKVARLQAEVQDLAAKQAQAAEGSASESEEHQAELQRLRAAHASELSTVTAGATSLSKHVSALRVQLQQAEAQAAEAGQEAAAAVARAQQAEAALATERAATQVQHSLCCISFTYAYHCYSICDV